MSQEIQLSEHFTIGKLLRFTIPSIVMMIFSSIYSVIDGIFISNFVGKTPFAAINLIMPLLMIFGAIGFMVGTGGSALVSKTLGEGNKLKANQLFSMLIYLTIGFGIVLSIAGFILIREIATWLGAEGDMIKDCVLYARILLPVLSAYILQNVFQAFLVTAGKPKLGLAITIISGVANIILDWLFIVVFGWGLTGAAVATAISQILGGFVPLIYFLRPNTSLLRLTRGIYDKASLLKACVNGSSEFVSNISMSVVAMLYNFQLMKYAGEDGVAAYGVIMYVNFIFLSVFFGYSIGCAPIIGFNYGANNYNELRNLFRKSLISIFIGGILLTALAESLSLPLSKLFVGYDSKLLDLTHHGFMLYSLSFLIAGFNTFGSAFFTALNNGVLSASISFLRILVFEIGAVLVLPLFFGIDGIWLAIVCAEVMTLIISFTFFIVFRHKYHYQ